ncbi:MAG: hypothetical protein KAJ24_00595 [Candidatus Aenigmarchaeota archaeon]|nr:hypothetical protein [Candidatus Aenigmarchaeota archaeon]
MSQKLEFCPNLMLKRQQAIERIKTRSYERKHKIIHITNEHQLILLGIIRKQDHITTQGLWHEYKQVMGNNALSRRGYRCSLMRLSKAGLIVATGYGRGQGYSKKEKIK